MSIFNPFVLEQDLTRGARPNDISALMKVEVLSLKTPFEDHQPATEGSSLRRSHRFQCDSCLRQFQILEVSLANGADDGRCRDDMAIGTDRLICQLLLLRDI